MNLFEAQGNYHLDGFTALSPLIILIIRADNRAMQSALRCARGFFILVQLLVSAPFAIAADEPQLQTFRLELQKMDGVNHGMTSVVKGAVGPQPHRFLVDGLNINMPVTVLVRPVRSGDEIKMRLTKYAWNQSLREQSTVGKPLGFRFSTEGEFQIAINADKPTPYRLLVWAGEEVKPELRPVVIKASDFKTKTTASTPQKWVITGALAVITILLGILVLRRKSP